MVVAALLVLQAASFDAATFDRLVLDGIRRGAYPGAALVIGRRDTILFAKRNSQWAAVIEPDKPIDKRPNTWAIRYGDVEWKAFLDFWGAFVVVNGEMDRLFRFHMEKLGAA